MARGGSKRRASRPTASSWDKVSARDAQETLANRDVHGNQQLDRSKIGAMRSKVGHRILAVLVGVVVFVLVWATISLVALAITSLDSSSSGKGSGDEPSPYYREDTKPSSTGETATCYLPLDRAGNPAGYRCYDKLEQIPVPRWFERQQQRAEKKGTTQAGGTVEESGRGLGDELASVSWLKFLLSAGAGLAVGATLGAWASRRVDAENLMHDTSDINQHTGDQHIALPEEVQRKFDWFPDAGAHSSVQVSSVISHMMLNNKGLKKIAVTEHADADVVNSDGEIVHHKGEMLLDRHGEPVVKRMPIIDEQFGDDLFDASGLPADKELRKKYNTSTIPYNPGDENRDKLTGYKQVSDLINGDWEFPEYERQRPGGAYIVDTAPVNTMVLAITRAGKGQTFIEPTLDMWSREKKPSNMVINDPKGELLVKNYVPFVTRGYEPVQFNLINAMKTDIYNPLGMAADAAREGDSTKCALYVENIADVFFPLDGGEDPVWPNAANNAFKRAAYGLIDFYLEEERILREQAAREGTDMEVLQRKLDDMWGKVTLYNCYQLFVQLTSKKLKNPQAELKAKIEAGVYDDDEAGLERARDLVERQAFLWEDKPEQDMLTLYFNATEALPTNTMRTLIGNANNALRAMAGAEKMLASVYGIAITAMSFFTDPTISTLTSGKPSQNVDLGGLSFPRRIGVRLHQHYLRRDHLIGQQARWSAYADEGFTQRLGEDFEHSDIVSREGWARYYFKGILPADQAWLKLELVNPGTQMLVRTFYFRFRKTYQTSLTGRHYVTEPVTGKKIIRDGVLVELRPVKDAQTGETVVYKPGDTLFPNRRLIPTGLMEYEPKTEQIRAITQTMVRYSEAPKAVFLVTPPHLMKYAKLILILLKQLVDLNFDKSYMTKSNQKPLYKTRFMLDELGNLQSEGHGISGLETMLSIGLGQEQQFTLILQTLQQLRDVYGESVDKIVQGNVSNIVFLKSTDDSMMQTLEKMSGTRHKAYIKSKTITKDVERIAMQTEGKVSYTMDTVEEPVISYNDMAFIPERNSITFRAGDAPVWNRNETILPMSWRLAESGIVHPGHDYSLQTIPTLSTAIDFDVRTNQPDFVKMLWTRIVQAERAEQAKTMYREAYGYSDFDIERLDPDLYSDEVMSIIDSLVEAERGGPDEPRVVDADDLSAMVFSSDADFIDNVEVQVETQARLARLAELQRKIYAQGMISKEMLINPDGSAKTKTLDAEMAEAFRKTIRDLGHDVDHFVVDQHSQNLLSADGKTVYIRQIRSQSVAEQLERLHDRGGDPNSRVFDEHEDSVDASELRSMGTVEVTGDFYRFLASLSTWEHLAGGEFDRAVAQEMRNKL